MKKLYLSIVALGAIVGASLFLDCGDCGTTAYQPRENDASKVDAEDGISGYFEYINELKKNVVTGKVEREDVANAISQIESMQTLGKASFPLQWESAGPEDIGGRSRAFIVDNKDNNVLYVGGVNGGVWKSTNKGASWFPLTDELSSLAVGSMCQTPNGDIYFGTGEGFTSVAGGETYTPGFPGEGIFRSTDGENFTKLTTSSIFSYVYRLANHPTQDLVYAATNLGLYYSDNEGTTWNRLRAGGCTDVVVDINGNVIAVFANRIYRSTTPTVADSYDLSTGTPVGARAVIAVSESDPNFVYTMITGAVTIEAPAGDVSVGAGLVGIYQSKDNGITFEQIVGKENPYFNLMSHLSLGSGQGVYNSCIGVHPTSPERVFVGGIEFGEWTPQAGPRIVGNLADFPTNPRGIHADKHLIRFDTKSDPPIMYILHDGGLSKTTNAAMDRYATITTQYQTTQFFGLDVGPTGAILGGTQDQRTILIDLKGSTPRDGINVLGGDGGRTEISDLNGDIMFAQQPNGFMYRSLNSGGGWSPIWDQRINEDFTEQDDPTNESDPYQPASTFSSPLRLWENPETGENRLFYCVGNGSDVWMADDVVNTPNPIWYKVGNFGGRVVQLEMSKDGNTLFAGTNGRLFRVDGFNDVTWDTTGALAEPTAIATELQRTRIDDGFPNASMTDVEIDYNDGKRLIVTFGNYNVSDRVFITNDAMADDPVFRSIDGALPNMPIFDAEISWENPDHIILGTEFGIWATENGSATSPLWTKNSDGFPNTAVYEMKQTELQRKTWRTGPTLYAATHGRGIFKTFNLLTSAKEIEKPSTELIVYPNPTVGNININFTAQQNDRVEVSLYNLQGKLMTTSIKDVVAGQQSSNMDLSEMPSGIYFVKVKGTHHEGSYRVVKSN